ncbi:MAG: hypothetical protein WDM96_11960 [Lacunisphaera sp.]
MSAAAATWVTGNNSGAGKPPAKEITSGCAVTFRISRMVDGRIWSMRWAKRWAYSDMAPMQHIPGRHASPT